MYHVLHGGGFLPCIEILISFGSTYPFVNEIKLIKKKSNSITNLIIGCCVIAINIDFVNIK